MKRSDYGLGKAVRDMSRLAETVSRSPKLAQALHDSLISAGLQRKNAGSMSREEAVNYYVGLLQQIPRVAADSRVKDAVRDLRSAVGTDVLSKAKDDDDDDDDDGVDVGEVVFVATCILFCL